MSFAFIDRNAILDDERQQRLKRMRLIERENAEMAPFWAEKQKAQFPTAIQLTQKIFFDIMAKVQTIRSHPILKQLSCFLILAHLCNLPSLPQQLQKNPSVTA
jgi:hypothetical protein